MKKILGAVVTAMVFGAAASSALAQDFPTRPIKLLVPYGPGTGIDLATRVIADRLGKALGQTVVVENRAGAAGTIAAAAVAAAPADGYTLLADVTSHTIAPALMKGLSYDAKRDFTPVAMFGESPIVMVTSGKSGYKTVKDLVAAAKAKPGSLNFASAGVGTVTHLSAEKFRKAAGITALHVPFKSTTDALTEVMAGRIDYVFTAMPSAIGPAKDGRLVALAVGLRRSPAMPNVPTLAEAGIANSETSTWFGILAPAKTPRDVVNRIHQAAMKEIATPEYKEALAKIGVDPYALSLAEFDALLKRDFAENEQLIKAAGIKLE